MKPSDDLIPSIDPENPPPELDLIVAWFETGEVQTVELAGEIRVHPYVRYREGEFEIVSGYMREGGESSGAREKGSLPRRVKRLATQQEAVDYLSKIVGKEFIDDPEVQDAFGTWENTDFKIMQLYLRAGGGEAGMEKVRKRAARWAGPKGMEPSRHYVGPGEEPKIGPSNYEWMLGRSQYFLDRIPMLDRVIAKAPPLPEDLEVHRELPARVFKGLDVGDVVEDKGFVATAASPEGVGAYKSRAKPARMVIRVPAGTPASWNAFQSQFGIIDEFVLPRGSRFKITSRDGDTVHVDYLGSEEIADARPKDISPSETEAEASPPRTDPGVMRLADLPEKARKQVEKWGEKYDLDLDAVAEDILTSFDNADAVRTGEAWYREEFKASAQVLADKYGTSRAKASAVIAITSAQKRWSQKNGQKPNLEQAEKFLRAWYDGEAEGDTDEAAQRLKPKMGYFMDKSFGLNVLKLLKDEMTIDEAIRGAKRRSFFDNGYSPEVSTAITNDTWMATFMANHSTRPKEKLKSDLAGEAAPNYLANLGIHATPAYVLLSEAVMRAHERALAEGRVPAGWLPHQTQATAWMEISRRAEAGGDA